MLSEINHWCLVNNVRPFRAEHLGDPDGDASKVVALVPELSYAQSGKAGLITFQKGRVKGGVVTPTYMTSRRIHCWATGLSPAEVEGVVTIVLVRTTQGIFARFANTYRDSIARMQLEGPRGFASDVDWRGEEVDYADVLLPQAVWSARHPTDGVLGLRAAQQEITEEMLGATHPRRLWYLGCCAEADTFAHTWSGVYLVLTETGDLETLRPDRPDPSQHGFTSVPLAALPGVMYDKMSGTTVLAATGMALAVVQRVRDLYGDLASLWTGVWNS